MLKKADNASCSLHSLPEESIETLRPTFSSGEIMVLLYLEYAGFWLPVIHFNATPINRFYLLVRFLKALRKLEESLESEAAKKSNLGDKMPGASKRKRSNQ